MNRIERKKQFMEYMATVAGRLDKGAAEYGEKSFSREPSALLTEIQEELADVCGWAFILWARVQKLEKETAGTICKKSL